MGDSICRNRALCSFVASREEAFRTHYEVLDDMPSPMPFGINLDKPGGGLPLTSPSQCPAFHYGTHYMSAAVVLHYLIRLQVCRCAQCCP